jgi:hypothetical protein
MPGAPNALDFVELAEQLKAPPISKPHTYLHVDVRILSLPLLKQLLGEMTKRRKSSPAADAAILAIRAHILEREEAIDASTWIFEG